MISPPLPPPSGLSEPVKLTLYLSFKLPKQVMLFEDDDYDGSFQPAYISILSFPKYIFSAKLELGQ